MDTASHFTRFLLQHGYSVIFFWVLAEQGGIPLPSIPLLLTAGALAAEGHFSSPALIAIAMSGAMLSDFVWYELGRRRGGRILSLLCRISIEPDSCVKNTENLFVRRGPASLLVAKFIPGLNTVAQPMAGIVGLSWPRFLAYDFAGALLWSGTLIGAGAIFHRQVQDVLDFLHRSGLSLAAALFIAALLWVGYKYIQRRRFIHKLRVARITPEELKRRVDAGEEMFVVDLRNPHALSTTSVSIPGALRLTPDELEHRHQEVPRDKEIVLYCT